MNARVQSPAGLFPQLVNICFLEMTINSWDISTKIDRPTTDRICAIVSFFILLLENILIKLTKSIPFCLFSAFEVSLLARFYS